MDSNENQNQNENQIEETQLENVDRISSLPDDIITNKILSLLPTRDSVRTSALSTRWKHLYASVPILDFYLSENPGPIGSDSAFTNFITKVLNTVTKKLSFISKLSIHHHTPSKSSNLMSWIDTAVSHSVQELNICFDLEGSFPTPLLLLTCEAPRVLFSCETLVSMSLDVSFEWVVPELVYLPKLKELMLMNIFISDDKSLKLFFSGCPVLECLTLVALKMYNHRVFDISVPSLKILNVFLYYTDGELLINCPNLEVLRCETYPARGFSGNVLGSLKKSYIEMQLSEEQLNEGKVMELVKQVCLVQSLTLAGDSMEALLIPPCLLPTFENLTHLELKPYRSKGWRLLTSMLESSPRLQTLVFPVGFFDIDDYDGVPFSPPEHVPDCLSYHLKVIRINRFLGEEDEYVLVEYFLTNALVLEKFEISLWSSEGSEEGNGPNEEGEAEAEGVNVGEGVSVSVSVSVGEAEAETEAEGEDEDEGKGKTEGEEEEEEDGEFKSDLELNLEITKRLLTFRRFSEVCQIVVVSSKEKWD